MKARSVAPSDAPANEGNRLGPRQIWGMPVLLTVTSSAALVIGLLADGLADVVAYVGLGVPAAVAAWHLVRAASKRPE